MRRTLKMLGLGLAAVLAFGAFSATSASASQPEAKDEEGKNPAGITLTEKEPANGGILETSESEDKVECTGTAIVEAELTSETKSVGVLINTGCVADGPFGTEPVCTSTSPEAENEGEIKSELEGELVYTGPEKNVPAMWFWTNKAGEAKGGTITEFTCGDPEGTRTEVTVQGGLVCEIGPTGTLTNMFTLTCEQTAGVNVHTSFADPGNCNEVPDFLESEGEGFGFGAPSWGMQRSGLEANHKEEEPGKQDIETSAKIEIEAAAEGCV